MFSGSDLVQSHRVNLITIALSNVSITLQLPCVKTSNYYYNYSDACN